MLGTFNAWHSWRRYWPSRDSDYLQQTDASSLQQLFLFVVWGALDVLRDERRRFSVFGSLNIEGNVFSVDKLDEWLNCFEAVLINFPVAVTIAGMIHSLKRGLGTRGDLWGTIKLLRS